MLNDLLPAVFVLMGTMIQMMLSLREVATTRGDAIVHKSAEDELIRELSPWQRPRARRDLIRSRAPETHRAIREAQLHVLAWALLFGAAASATFNTLLGTR